MTKEFIHKKAVKLRKAGYSYSFIQKKTDVSKSTLCKWLSGLPYTRNKETINKINSARLKSSVSLSLKKKISVEKANNLAINDIGNFTKRDLFILGIGLYLGEGSKTANIIRVTNSDPKIIRTSIIWFKKIFNLQNNNFSIRIHLYPDNSIEKSIYFWLRQTGLPKSSFLKTWVDTRSDKKKVNCGKLSYGTAHLSIIDAKTGKAGLFLFRRILSQINIVHKYAGMV